MRGEGRRQIFFAAFSYSMFTFYVSITDYIRKELGRNVVFTQGMDTSNVQKKMLLQTVVNKQELISLKEYVKDLGDDSFVYAAQSTAVIGKGFPTME